MATAIMTRNCEIGIDLLVHLRNQMTLEEVAGVILISIERLLWFDNEAVFWSIKNLIPGDVMQEIHKMTSLSIYKQLINRGFVPGKHFSVDAYGKLLLSPKAKTAVLPGMRV